MPELLPIRYGRMAVSPFTFYRGAAAVMAADLATTPTSGLRVQMCGDAHLSNFGVFAAPDRRLVFDLNDFDETLPGPWEWDVKRLAASFEIAARDNGFKRKERTAVVETVARTYREAIREFAKLRNLEIWYARLDAEQVLQSLQAERPKSVKKVEKAAAKARAKDSLRAQARLTHRVDGELRIISKPPLIVPVEEIEGAADYDFETVIRKVLDEYTDDPEGGPRPPARGLRVPPPGPQGRRRRQRRDPRLDHPADRPRRRRPAVPPGQGSAVLGARALRRRRPLSQPRPAGGRGPVADAGRQRHLPRLVLERRPRRPPPRLLRAPALGPEGVERHRNDGSPGDGDLRARLWLDPGTGPRPLRRPGRDRRLPGLGATFDSAIAEFSAAYADQNERDHAALLEAIKSGRLEAEDA